MKKPILLKQYLKPSKLKNRNQESLIGTSNSNKELTIFHIGPFLNNIVNLIVFLQEIYLM